MLKRITLLLSTCCSLILFSALAVGSSHSAALKIGEPLPAGLLNKLVAASDAGLKLKTAPAYNQLQEIQGPNPAPQGKVGVLYVGADFCPYCAAVRWPLTIALMRFGMLFGVETMRSSPTDVYPDTTTLSFTKAQYLSPLVQFDAIETATRLNKPLEPLKGQAARLFRKFNAPPYTSRAGGIPFLYIDGRWLLLGTPVNPQLLGKTDWNSIADQLNDPHSKLGSKVLHQANMITAAICDSTGNKPETVCNAPGVTAAADLLPPR